MTYKTFKNIVKGLLTGDNVLPSDPDVILALLEYAYTRIATKADSLRLMSVGSATEVLRLAQDGYLVRFPELPILDEDELDIDQELCYPVARYVAADLSKDKAEVHMAAADREIKDYNAKVWEMMSTIQSGLDEKERVDFLSDRENLLWQV